MASDCVGPAPAEVSDHMRFPRFTIRRMMAAVAIVALVIGGAVTWHRSLQFARATAAFSQKELSVATTMQSYSWTLVNRSRTDPAARLLRSHGEPQRSQLRLDHFRALRAKYLYASRHPWLPVAPDPPEPK